MKKILDLDLYSSSNLDIELHFDYPYNFFQIGLFSPNEDNKIE